MTIVKLKITGDNLDLLVNFLVEELEFSYENHSQNMSILAAENLSFRNPLGQVNLVIFKRETSFILVDIMAGGGNRGFLDIIGNSEKGYTRIVMAKINTYAEERGLVVEMLGEL
jgi:hypothetical protein